MLIRKGRTLLAATALSLTLVAGCQTMLPALASLVLSFGQDMLAAAAVNYTPRYAHQLENLLAALAREATGMNFQPQLQQAGYVPPEPRYMRKKRAQDSQASNSGYASNDTADYDDYGSEEYDQYEGDDEYEDDGEYEVDSANDPNLDPALDPNIDPSSDPYADPYANSDVTDDQIDPEDDPYNPAAYAVRTRGGSAGSLGSQKVSLGAALLVQRAGTDTLEAVEDGAIIRDGRGNPAQGDLLKVHFRSNCACYVYIIGVDATGFVAQIFPDEEGGQTNPVLAGQDYLLPGDGDWWALDDTRGVETLYFISSETERLDLNQALAGLSAAATPLTRQQPVRSVREPAIIPAVRGLVKVTSGQVSVQSGGQNAMVNPTAFVNTLENSGVTATRWFRHQ